LLIRHLTGDPKAMAAWAAAYFGAEPELFLADRVLAEAVFVLTSFYKAPRPRVADAIRSRLAL